MITKVNRIQNFGVFKNFSWQTATPPFKQFNLIYGWNYSGKTTFSRIFQCFELGVLHENYLPATFELEDDQGKKYDQTFNSPPVIRVFNSDFIRRNLQWDNESIEPIFMLGEENAELQKKLSDKKTEIELEEGILQTSITSNRERLNAIEQKITDKAKTLSEFFGWRNFTKTHFRPLIGEVQNKTKENTLSTPDFVKLKSQALASEIKRTHPKLSLKVTKLNALKDSVDALLQKQVTAKTIQKLIENLPLSKWVETGIQIHSGQTICQFCENTISSNRIEELNNHFSKDFEKLKNSLSSEISKLENSILNVGLLPESSSIYPDIQDEYATIKSALENEVSNYNSVINLLLNDLKLKIDKPFDKLQVTDFSDNYLQLEEAISSFNEVIEKNNTRTDDFDKQKNAAISKLKYHYAAEFEVEENCGQTFIDIDKTNTDLVKTKEYIEVLKSEKLAIESQLSETVKGAETVNSYLKMFFGKDEIAIKVTDGNKFTLLREQHQAKNLSEGEKTAIAFAYFTAKLEERKNKLSDSIIYIDDPISSLDSNHLFNLYSFIKIKFVDAKQLFISSHNFEFFNLLKEWFQSNKEIKKNNQGLFLIERPNNGGFREAEIKNIHKLLEDFKSEYHYLFWLIYRFKESPSTDFYQLYNLPNLLRRYLEAFLGFKVPKHLGLEGKLEFLIIDKTSRERVLKFVHHYSHGNSLSRALNFPDLQECISIVQIVINAVEGADKTHYDSLVEVVNPILA